LVVPVVGASTVPANWPPAPTENAPLSCQKTFEACASPVRMIFAPARSDNAPLT
jgi:hypothetical protein